MLAGELDRQARLKNDLGADPESCALARGETRVPELQAAAVLRPARALFQSHASRRRGEQTFAHVPLNADEDVTVTIRPHGEGVYALSPYPFAADEAEFAFAGR